MEKKQGLVTSYKSLWPEVRCYTCVNYKKGGFVTIRHNNIRDYEANLLAKIHTLIETEPFLQPVEEEIVNGIPGDNARR